MSRLYIAGNAVDQNQIPVVGAQVYVRAGGVTATLEDVDGNPLANPLITVADGFFEGYSTSSGEHTLEYYWGGKLRYIEAVSEIDRIQAIADDAEAAAQLAQAFTGPIYLTTVDGLADTVNGDEFAVDNGDGTAGIYLNNAGAAVLQRTIIIAPDNSGTSALLGHISAGAGAVARTVRDKLRETVSPEDFSGTDTAKFQAALATGKPVVCSATSYAITGSLTPSAAGQIVDLNGALLTCTGSFDIFNVTGLQGVTIRNGRIDATAMTGGEVLSIVNADRTTFENILVFNPFNFAFVQKANVVEINNVWVNNIRGAFGIRWLGDAINRSDVLRLVGVIMSFPDTGIGIDWDGNCHTLQAFGVIIVRPDKGVRISNTAGATAPAFGFFTNLEIDFPQSYGVEILAGEDYYFGPQLYCHGSVAASGIYVGASVTPNRVHFAGGKISGNATYGIENNVRVYAANLVLTGNTTADYLDTDDIVTRASRLEIDNTSYFQIQGGNPYWGFDTTDFMSFDRGSNVLATQVSGTPRFQISAMNDAIEIMVNNALKRITEGAADSGGAGFKLLRVPN